MPTAYQALPVLKRVPVMNAQFKVIGEIKTADLFYYKSSDAVNAFGTIERFGTGIVMFEKSYFTTTNWVKITTVSQPTPKTTPQKKPAVPPGSLTSTKGTKTGFFRGILLYFWLMLSRLFGVISWLTSSVLQVVTKSIEFVAKAVWQGITKASKSGTWFYIALIVAFFLFFPSTAFALIRALGEFLSNLISGKSSKNKSSNV